MAAGQNQQAISRKSPEVLVPFLGLIYFTLLLLYFVVSFGASAFTLIFVPFLALFLLSAYGIWRLSRIGYLVSVVMSAIFLALEGTMIAEAFSAVTIPSEFLSVVTGVPVLLAVLIYSILGLRRVWRKGILPGPSRMMPASSFIILLTVGFIIGGITVGLVAAQTESRLINSAGGDITIVQGAGNQNNAQFYSSTPFTVKLVAGGTTVTWVNHDGTTHTVTSKGSNLFDSVSIPTGGTFSYKFTQVGTYE